MTEFLMLCIFWKKRREKMMTFKCPQEMKIKTSLQIPDLSKHIESEGGKE